MNKFARSMGVSVKKVSNYIKEKKRQVSAFALVGGVSLVSAVPTFAATPSTGNTDFDDIVSGFTGMFDVAKLGFKGLAIASIALTVIVVLFFWIRGKSKQAVAGA